MDMAKDNKIIPLSRLRKTVTKVDTVQERKTRLGTKLNRELLERCADEWENLRRAREERERALRYSYGDQWGDIVNYKGESMTEREYISKEGKVALSNKLIRRLVNAVVGSYVKAKSEPICLARDPDKQLEGQMMTLALQCNWQTNKMESMLATQFEDFLHGGMAISRETYDYRNEMRDSWTDFVNPNYVFFSSTMRDPRHWDISMIGEIHDITFEELCTKFGKSKEDYDKLSEIYSAVSGHIKRPIQEPVNEKNDIRRIDFWNNNDTNLCRVYEVWTKEMKPRYRCHDWSEARLYKINVEDLDREVTQVNNARIRQAAIQNIPIEEVPLIEATYFFDNYWYYQFLTPTGEILDEGETPFEHKCHPYTVKLYPFINGEIHPFISDVIDQQRYINRLVTLNDFVVKSTAKGVLLVPANAVPDDMTPEEFAEQWVSFDGIVMYQPKPGVPMPQQIANKSTNIGLTEMINLQLKLMEDISGVHGAAQGKEPYSGTSAALYAQQSANASTMLLPVTQSFDDYVLEIAIKKAKNIQQYYEEPRMINISGKAYRGIKRYNPELARDLEYDLSIVDNAATPVNRMIANDQLKEFWAAGAITLEQLLEYGDFPYSHELLQNLRAQRESMEQQQNSGIPQLDQSAVDTVRGQIGQGNTALAENILRQAN